MVRRHELTDQAWAQIAPLLPPGGRPGGQWADHRRVVNGILWKLATGVPWRDLPERYGPWQTCYERFRRWQADGTWQRLLAHAQTPEPPRPVSPRGASAFSRWTSTVPMRPRSCRPSMAEVDDVR